MKTGDTTKRNELIAQAQTIEQNEGGYIVWAFNNQIDAYSSEARRRRAQQVRRAALELPLQQLLLRLRRRLLRIPICADSPGRKAGAVM